MVHLKWNKENYYSGKYIHTCTNKKISFLLQRSQDVYFRQSMYI